MSEQSTTQLTMTQKIVAGLISTVILWSGYTTNNTATRVAVIESNVNSVMGSLYTAQDAMKDQQTLNERMNAMSERMNALGGRITALEQDR
jgi:hypothetical protein